jgi:hypothetical protein
MNCVKRDKLGSSFGIIHFMGFDHHPVLKMKTQCLEQANKNEVNPYLFGPNRKSL